MDAMRMLKLTDKNGNDITVQQAYDAAMSGPVYVSQGSESEGNLSMEIFTVLNLEDIIRENENVISIVFTGISGGARCHFYAGENPNNIDGGRPVQ